VAALRHLTSCVDVSFLELGSLPRTSPKHLSRQLCLKLGTSGLIVGTLGDFVGLL